MRHRIGGININNIGIGNPDPEKLDNRGKLNPIHKRMLKDAIKIFPLMKSIGGCDFKMDGDSIMFGIEPAYKGERLEMICLMPKKEESFICRGIAFGYYGSNIVSTTKEYGDYLKRGKFVKFVDKWQPCLITVRGR